MGLSHFRVIKYDYLDHGDAFEDAATLIASHNFVKFGFIRCRFLRITTPQIDRPMNFYTHMPNLHEIAYGLLSKILRTDSLKLFRLFAIIVSCFILFLWFYLMRKLFDDTFAILCLFFFATNPLFINFADSVSRYLSMELCRILAIICFVKLFENNNKQKILLILMWLMVFVISLLDYAYVVVVWVFMFGYSLLFKKHLRKRYWLLLMSASILAFLLHFLQNAWALGGIENAYNDLFGAFLRRTVGKGKSEIPQAMFTFKNWLKLSFLVKLKIADMFNKRLLVLPVLVFSVIFFRFSRFKISKDKYIALVTMLKLLILFFISGISWWVLFVQQSWVHGYQNALHILPASVFLTTSTFYLLYLLASKLKMPKSLKVLACIIIAFLVLKIGYSNILKSDIPFTPYKRQLKLINFSYKYNLEKIGASMSPKEEIWTNYWNYFTMGYYSDRNCRQVGTFEQFDSIAVKPRYFFFYPYKNKSSNELYTYLRKNYKFIGKSLSQNVPYHGVFPYMIFEKSKEL